MNANQGHEDSGRQEIQRLAEELAVRRARVSQLVTALERKVSAGELMGKGGEFAKQLGSAVKGRPLPSLAAAASLAWLYAGRAPDDAPSDNGAEAGGTLKDKAHGAGEALREHAHAGLDGARKLLDENPAAAGAIAVAVGALLGALVPPTRKEDELWGEARDKLAGRARELGARAVEQARDAEQADAGGNGRHGTTPGLGSGSDLPTAYAVPDFPKPGAGHLSN